MTREILFRGKSIHGEWIYGYLNQHRGNIRYDCDCEPIADGCYYINDWQAKIDTGMYGQDYKVDPDTIGQFTGLTDKNGTKIFEGDIVAGTAYSSECIGVIVWIDEIGGFGVRYRSREDPTSWENSSILKAVSMGRQDNYAAQIIGNICDSSELLEVSGSD